MGKFKVVVLVSADAEWRAVREFYPDEDVKDSPYGEWFDRPLSAGSETLDVCFMYGGWGKISAAASAQFAIDTWSPSLIVNLGTCGGFDGHIARDAVILVNRTLVYDIIEQMADQDATVAHYTTDLDLSWLCEPYPMPVQVGLLLSGDRDLIPEQVEDLHGEYGAVAGDWESASIAYVAKQNGVPCLILRMVTDLVGKEGGEVYDGKLHLFHQRARFAMHYLLSGLPQWLSCAGFT